MVLRDAIWEVMLHPRGMPGGRLPGGEYTGDAAGGMADLWSADKKGGAGSWRCWNCGGIPEVSAPLLIEMLVLDVVDVVFL